MNHGDANGTTPLMRAIKAKNLEDVKFLLDCGADVKKADKRGKTLLVLLPSPQILLILGLSCFYSVRL